MKRSMMCLGIAATLAACSANSEAPDAPPVELPNYEPLEDLPAGTRTVVRVDPAQLESFQAAVMARFDGNAPMPADLDVALATTSAALIYPPQPTRLFSTSPGRDPLPSLDRSRPIYHAMTTEPALGFIDALRVGKAPLVAPALGARLYLPADDAEKLAEEFGYFCQDGRNQSMTQGCRTVASHSARKGWVVVELDYGSETARVRTSGSTSWPRDTAAVAAFAEPESGVAVWIEAGGVAEIGAVMAWHASADADIKGESDGLEQQLEAMAPLLRSDPGARETEDLTFALRLEGSDIAVDGVRTLTQRGLARAEAGQGRVDARSFDVKDPILVAELPWSSAGVRSATEPPQWSEDEAAVGRVGSGQWRQAVPWLEAPFAYYIGLAWGPRPVRSAGWLRVFFSLDGGRLRLDASADDASPWGFDMRGGVAVVTSGDTQRAAVSSVLEGLVQQVAAALSSSFDSTVVDDGPHGHIVSTLGKTRSIDAAEGSNVVLEADLERAADLLDASGNTEMFGPQLTTILRAAGAVEVTYDRQGAAEAWRLHIGLDDIASAEAPAVGVEPLLLEPIDPCVIEARRAAVTTTRATMRGMKPTPVDYPAISQRCTTDEGRRLLAD